MLLEELSRHSGLDIKETLGIPQVAVCSLVGSVPIALVCGGMYMWGACWALNSPDLVPITARRVRKRSQRQTSELSISRTSIGGYGLWGVWLEPVRSQGLCFVLPCSLEVACWDGCCLCRGQALQRVRSTLLQYALDMSDQQG